MNDVPLFSKKQMQVLTWWLREETRGYDAVICDGAVRSGKTLSMSLSFVLWAMSCFTQQAFGLCGRTVSALRRNLVVPLLPRLSALQFSCQDKPSRGYVDVRLGKRRNRFYLFGGKDESSQSLIQGATLAGVLLDEVALMPQSFAQQAVARCSVEGSRFWFNCNPQHPYHWFYREWVCKAAEKNALYLHFTMEDNPSLTPQVRQRYEHLYSGAFYDRFVLGKWTAAQGLVYPMFAPQRHVVKTLPSRCERYYVSCDYGTVNPSSFGLWGEYDGKWYRLREYYYDARREGRSRTDEEHYAALETLIGGTPVECVVIDPSAASFIECIRRHGRYRVRPAQNDVLGGIRRVGDLLQADQLLFHESCVDTLREFALYCWDLSNGTDRPKKEHDHAMDDLRYFVSTALRPAGEGFCVLSARRYGTEKGRIR